MGKDIAAAVRWNPGRGLPHPRSVNNGWIPRLSPAPCLEEAGSTAGREKQLVRRLPSTEHSPDVKRGGAAASPN